MLPIEDGAVDEDEELLAEDFEEEEEVDLMDDASSSRRRMVEEKKRRAKRPYGSWRKHLAVERMRECFPIEWATGWEK